MGDGKGAAAKQPPKGAGPRRNSDATRGEGIGKLAQKAVGREEEKTHTGFFFFGTKNIKIKIK